MLFLYNIFYCYFELVYNLYFVFILIKVKAVTFFFLYVCINVQF